MKKQELEAFYTELEEQGKEAGYFLNPDKEFVLSILEGMLTNRERYGYPGCPCIELSGKRARDLDVICPCDYREEDLEEFGMCYCGLYVSEEVVKGEKKVKPIPLRRALPEERATAAATDADVTVPSPLTKSKFPVWRCSVCGYLCSRTAPPLKCPICKADQDRFQDFNAGTYYKK